MWSSQPGPVDASPATSLGLRGCRDHARLLDTRRHPSIPALPSGRSRAPLTPEQRDARRREQLEQLRQATSALLTSEGWQRWLRTRSRFHRYSLRNTLLIAFQCPHATHVAGFRKWLELGRCVRKGEKAIRIFAPVRYRRRDTEQSDENEAGEQLVGFKLAAVFDVSQTEPLPGVDPAPLDPPGQPVSGDSSRRTARSARTARSLARLQRQLRAARRPRRLLLRPRGAHRHRQRPFLRTERSRRSCTNSPTRTASTTQRFSRAEAELIVESVACIVCAAPASTPAGESVPYLAGWNPEQAVERIELLTGTIDEIARRIEHALDPGEQPSAPVAVRA